MPIKIRQVQEADLPALVRINREVGTLRPLSLAKLRKAFLAHQPPKGYFIIAEDGKKAAGWGAAEARKAWYIHHLYVSKSYQRRGIGSMLLKKLEAQGRKQRKKAVHLKTRTTNWRAVQFYSRHGYRISGIIKNKWGRGKHAFVMRKSL